MSAADTPVTPQAQPAGSASTQAHREAAPTSLRCAVLTVSDTRTKATDTSGQLIRDGLARQGHQVQDYQIAPDEPERIEAVLQAWIDDASVDVILSNGGTGISHRDTTYEVMSRLLEKRLDGFGELFRMLSFEEIGAAAMLSRAVAGVVNGTVVVCMPGSSNAVRLALERLLLPELGHLVHEVTKQAPK